MKTNWPVNKLGEVAKIFSGSSAPQGEIYFKDGNYPFVRVQDLGRYGKTKNLTETKDKINDLALEKHRLVLAHKGTILFPKSGAAILTNSRAILGIDAYIVGHLAAIVPNENITLRDWLYYLLANFDMSSLTKTTALPSLKLETIKMIEIPVPPIEEQKRIVAKLEKIIAKIDQARTLRQESIEDSQLLWSSALQKSFVQRAWPVKKLGEVARFFSGSSAPQGDIFFKEGKYPFVRVQDLGRYGRTKNLVETRDKVNDFALKKNRLVLAKKGTILFPKSGAAILTNSRAILGIDAYIVGHLAAIVPNEKIVSRDWLYYLLVNFDMGSLTKTTSLPSLKLATINNIEILVPPIEEQGKIVAYLDNLSEKVRRLQELQNQTQQDLELLTQSALHQAFSGQSKCRAKRRLKSRRCGL